MRIEERIIGLIKQYSNNHDLAEECGSEYIQQNDSARIDAIELVCDIFDLYANEE